jgi:hypothetical protein
MIALSLAEHHPGLDAVVARIAAAEFTDLPVIVPLGRTGVRRVP